MNRKIGTCSKCRLSKTRTHSLCGEGNPNARLMLIAQAPGENEDREGRMFIGPLGRILNEIFERVNIKREDIYLTNLIKCMLPGYRRPKRDEVEACSTLLGKEIELIDPRILAPLGYQAIRYIFGRYGIQRPPGQEFHTIYGKLFLK